MDAIEYWNDVAQEANRSAHTTPADSEKEVRGPAGSSRAFAIVHLAMHDAYFSINPSTSNPPHGTYLAVAPTPAGGASADAAIAAAAHATLSKLYPNQKAFLDGRHLAAPLDGPGDVATGHAHGLAVALAILALRAADPSTGDDGYAASTARGHHRDDPVNPGSGYHAPFYGAGSRNFAVTKRHVLASPPGLHEQTYLDAVVEVRGKGIAPELMGTLPAGSVRRTPEETLIGLFWAYDGAKGLGTPPRFYNQIIRRIAAAQHNTLEQNARLFALVNAAMGDAGILAWAEKYKHDLWRPVVGVREHDPSMGPLGAGGHTIAAGCDPGWLPLGAPKTNEPGKPNGTPNFPAYPSGHATFGAAAFQATRRYYGYTGTGPDDLADGLPFVSEELNAINTDNSGVVRPRHAREFPDGLWQMIVENGRSRVYLGVHWVFDAFAVDCDGEIDLTGGNAEIGGVPLGLAIADDIADNGLSATAAYGAQVTGP